MEIQVRHREELIRKSHTESSINAYLTNLLHGIGHCVPWIKGEVSPKYNSISDSSITQRLASEFANWGICYHMIAQEFVAWSIGVKGVVPNEHRKIITFTMPNTFDYSQIFGLQNRYIGQMMSTLEATTPCLMVINSHSIKPKNYMVQNCIVTRRQKRSHSLELQ
jgi:hypothetical protein